MAYYIKCIFNCDMVEGDIIFGFPRDAAMKKKWIENLSVDDAKSNEGVCIRHFKKEYIESCGLSENAIPSLLLGKNQLSTNVPKTNKLESPYFECDVINCDITSTEMPFLNIPQIKSEERKRKLIETNQFEETNNDNLSVCKKQFTENCFENGNTLDSLSKISIDKIFLTENPFQDICTDQIQETFPQNCTNQILDEISNNVTSIEKSSSPDEFLQDSTYQILLGESSSIAAAVEQISDMPPTDQILSKISNEIIVAQPPDIVTNQIITAVEEVPENSVQDCQYQILGEASISSTVTQSPEIIADQILSHTSDNNLVKQITQKLAQYDTNQDPVGLQTENNLPDSSIYQIPPSDTLHNTKEMPSTPKVSDTSKNTKVEKSEKLTGANKRLLESEISRLKLMVKAAQYEIKNLKTENERLRKLQIEAIFPSKTASDAGLCFATMIVSDRHPYEEKEKLLAQLIYNQTSQLYTCLRDTLGFKLPSVSALQNWKS